VAVAANARRARDHRPGDHTAGEPRGRVSRADREQPTIRNEQPGVSSGHTDTREGQVSAPTAAEPNANTAYSSNAAKFAAAYQLGLTLNDGEHDAAGEGRVDSHHYLP
jgi:hypothetical protein